ncbi:MAG TPA: hypothetical protein VHD86_04915 [Xanthobacteraceae bacterium]|nr:hypothetical protein [Xanthobacteraceae bacterium]
MKRFVLAIGVMAMAFGISSAARADYAVVKFKSGYCRVWTDTAGGPQDGRYLWWHRHHHWHHWHYRFHTLGAAERHLHWAVRWRGCHHWWW